MDTGQEKVETHFLELNGIYDTQDPLKGRSGQFPHWPCLRQSSLQALHR